MKEAYRSEGEAPLELVRVDHRDAHVDEADVRDVLEVPETVVTKQGACVLVSSLVLGRLTSVTTRRSPPRCPDRPARCRPPWLAPARGIHYRSQVLINDPCTPKIGVRHRLSSHSYLCVYLGNHSP
jgi:hypothetical protein